jgi:hypothetical protein
MFDQRQPLSHGSKIAGLMKGQDNSGVPVTGKFVTLNIRLSVLANIEQ